MSHPEIPVRKSEKSLLFLCRVILVVLGAACLWMAWVTVQIKPWKPLLIDTAPNLKEPVKSIPDVELSAGQKLELQARVEKSEAWLSNQIQAKDQDERAILDRLITLVGVYAAILSLTAFFTVRFAREDAAAQIARSAKELIDLKASIWNELPEMRNLKESLYDLLRELERVLPADSDWNANDSYESLNEAQRQNVLISESTIGALRIFISENSFANKEVLARLYRALARFYGSRFRKDRQQQDSERADVYARKSIELEPQNAYAYQLRGALYVARYRILKKQEGSLTNDELDQLLGRAESSLRRAQELDKTSIGVAYNLSLVLRFRDALDEAILISSESLDTIGTLPSPQVRKYAPSLYANLACYYAIKADQEEKAGNTPYARRSSFETIKAGFSFLQSRNDQATLSTFIDMIEKEMNIGDLKNFGSEEKAQIRQAVTTTT